MKKLIIILTILLASAIWSSSSAGVLDYIFSHQKLDTTKATWTLKAEFTFSAMTITRSLIAGRQAEIGILNAMGSGLSWQRQIWTGQAYTTFAVTGAFLFFPNSNSTPLPYDAGAGIIISAFNGYGVGVAYNAGTVPKKQRIMLTLNYGVNFIK
jgi:hypothetical protein